jgi:hypothetical protein
MHTFSSVLHCRPSPLFVLELYRDHSFDKDVSFFDKYINFVEAEFDILFDKMAAANYDVNVTWKTELSNP